MKKIVTDYIIVIQSSFFLFVMFDIMIGRHVFRAKL